MVELSCLIGRGPEGGHSLMVVLRTEALLSSLNTHQCEGQGGK